MDGLVWCIVFPIYIVCCVHLSEQNDVPEATLELLSPRGLRISIPGNNPNVKRVSFHININQKFHARESGQYSADTTKTKNSQWSWVFPQFRVKQGDVIYFWVYIIEYDQNKGIKSYATYGSEDVNQLNPHNDPSLSSEALCSRTETTVQPQLSQLLCGGRVFFNEKFGNLDRWDHKVTIGGTAPEDEFMVFMNKPLTNWVTDGKLFIKPSLLEDQYNETFVMTGQLNLPDCTSIYTDQCRKQAFHYLILPPIVSARLTTEFTFRYGVVEIRAKLPRGKWIVPELWLEPDEGLPSEKVVIAMARGNTDDSDYGWQTLEAGVVGPSRSSLQKRSRGTPWAQDFHTYKLRWTPNEMKFYVDNQEIHQVSSNYYPIMDKEAHLTLGVHVAGSREFPDNIAGKPWKNSDPKRFLKFWESKSSWHPSWGQDAALQVEWIKITAL